MDLFMIRRRSNWADAAELEATAAKSSAEGEKMSDEVRWIRSYVVEEDGRQAGDGLRLRGRQPGGDPPPRRQHRHVGRRDHQGRRHRRRPRGPGRGLMPPQMGRRRPESRAAPSSTLAAMAAGGLIGRDQERARLGELLDRAVTGEGALVLLAGEAGVGKTRLLDELAASTKAPVLLGAASHDSTPAYGPVVAALRSHLRAEPDAFADCGPLGAHLGLLLPELGPAPEEVDARTLREAVRCALVAVARERGALLVLDDLQWSDAATLELLAELGADARRHLAAAGRRLPLRRARRASTRCGACAATCAAAACSRRSRSSSLDEAGTAALLAELLGDAPSRPLVRAVHDRAQGLPFFVEELAGALCRRGPAAVRRGRARAGRGQRGRGPRDRARRGAAALRRPQRRGPGGGRGGGGRRRALRARGGDRAGRRGRGGGAARGRAGPRGRRRPGRVPPRPRPRGALPRRPLAAPPRAAPPSSASAWRRAARPGSRSPRTGSAPTTRSAPGASCCAPPPSSRRPTPTATPPPWPATRSSCGRRARKSRSGSPRSNATAPGPSWPASSPTRPAAGARSPRCAEDDGPALAAAQRRLGRVCAMQGDRAGAIEALTAAADAFAASGDPAAAAGDRLAASDFLQFAGRHGASLELSRRAGEEARAAERVDLQSRALAARGGGDGQARRLRARHGAGQAGALAGARQQLHGGGGRGLPAARHASSRPPATTPTRARR